MQWSNDGRQQNAVWQTEKPAEQYHERSRAVVDPDLVKQ